MSPRRVEKKRNIMNSQVIAVVFGLICTTMGHPRPYQDQRQYYYSQPYPFQQQVLGSYQLPQQQQQQQQSLLQYQLPASTSLLPNNVNSGVRYGQQQLLYVLPGGGQIYLDGSNGGQAASASGPVDSFVELVSNNNYWPGQKTADAQVHKPVLAERPEKLEEKPHTAENSLPMNSEPVIASSVLPLSPIAGHIESKPDKQAELQQALLQHQRYYFNQYAQQQPVYAQRPSIPAHQANFLYNFRGYPQLNDKASTSLAFQKLFQKASEQGGLPDKEPSGDSSVSHADESGPSIAQAKPQGVAVAGVGGVAAAAPVGTAIVGPGGMALSAPTATAVAGTKPSKPPSEKVIRNFLPKAASSQYYNF